MDTAAVAVTFVVRVTVTLETVSPILGDLASTGSVAQILLATRHARERSLGLAVRHLGIAEVLMSTVGPAAATLVRACRLAPQQNRWRVCCLADGG
jgi:hypothetical protein